MKTYQSGGMTARTFRGSHAFIDYGSTTLQYMGQLRINGKEIPHELIEAIEYDVCVLNMTDEDIERQAEHERVGAVMRMKAVKQKKNLKRMVEGKYVNQPLAKYRSCCPDALTDGYDEQFGVTHGGVYQVEDYKQDDYGNIIALKLKGAKTYICEMYCELLDDESPLSVEG